MKTPVCGMEVNITVTKMNIKDKSHFELWLGLQLLKYRHRTVSTALHIANMEKDPNEVRDDLAGGQDQV